MLISKNSWNSLFDQPDRHPHYRVDGKVYYSKLDALIAAESLGKHPEETVRFRCFDLFLGAIDFSKEPEDSYQELCKQRAMQLRNRYKYIRLWYSGGVDSHTTLMSFYRAGISPDEICFMSNEAWDGQELGNNLEFRVLTDPLRPTLQQMFPNAKQRVIRFTYDFWKSVDTINLDDTLFKTCISFPFGRDIPTAFEIDPTLQQAIDLHGVANVCELVGEPKCKVYKKDSLWWTNFDDIQFINCINIPNSEFFHVSPDFPEIYIKQCHMVKRGMESILGDDPDSKSIEIEKDMLLKNRLMERRNEFDLSGINAIDTMMMKGRDPREERFSTVNMINLMESKSHTKKIMDAIHAALVKDIPSQLKNSYRNSQATYKEFHTFSTDAWCLSKKKTMPYKRLWPKGYGQYD
jgi:hypothetical protein